MALLADAAHNLGDVLGLLLAWWAAWLGRRHPTRSHTYGFGHSSILASLTNAVVLLVGVGGISVEAVHRLIDGVPAGEVDGKTVMIVAAVGILVNGLPALLFARGRKDDLNVKGAFLHMAADAAVSGCRRVRPRHSADRPGMARFCGEPPDFGPHPFLDMESAARQSQSGAR